MEQTGFLGGYRVERRLGSGAFASVWLAHDDVLQAPVAVKVLADNWAQDPAVRERFIEEARLLRRLDDDHVVRVYGVGELDDGRPYFAMEWADGGTLEDRLASHRGPMPVDEATEITVKVLDGLAVIHSMGVVHRDIKPSNILFKTVPTHRRSDGSDQRILLGDLGLAKDLAVGSGFTLSAGTPAYMAPEQNAPLGIVDARADLYAVAAVLYEMVADGPARVPGSPSGAGDGIVERDIPRPSGVLVPDALWNVIVRGLSPDPEGRFTSAAEMATALDGFARPTYHRPLPTGTLTLFFTDIEGSTRLWEEHPEEMSSALRRHDALLRSTIDSTGGYVFKTVGDSFCAAFAAAKDAVEAAATAQRAIRAERWPDDVPVRVRMALHTGECEERGGDYFGPAVNRTARLESAAHGGQVVLSRSTADLVRDRLPTGCTLVDLGTHRLKDLDRPEDVFQLSVEGVPAEFPYLLSEAAPPGSGGGDTRRPKRTTIVIGAALLAVVVAAATLVLVRSGEGRHAISPSAVQASAIAPNPLLEASQLGGDWTGGGPIPQTTSSGGSCKAAGNPYLPNAQVDEEGSFADGTTASLDEDISQFKSAADARTYYANSNLELTKCGISLFNDVGTVVVQTPPIPAAPTSRQYCEGTTTYGPVDVASLKGSGIGDLTICGRVVITLIIGQYSSSHLGFSDLSTFLAEAVSQLKSALATTPRLATPPGIPSSNLLQDALVSADDLGSPWRADSALGPPTAAPRDCGGPGIPAPQVPQGASFQVLGGLSDGRSTIYELLTYYPDENLATAFMSDIEAVNKLCTFAGDEASQHWKIDSSAPKQCDQSFVVVPSGSSTPAGTAKAYLRCGHVVSQLLVTPTETSDPQIPDIGTLMHLLASKNAAVAN